VAQEERQKEVKVMPRLAWAEEEQYGHGAQAQESEEESQEEREGVEGDGEGSLVLLHFSRRAQGHVEARWGASSCMVATLTFYRTRGGRRCGQGGC
jgi:hypothetical protein